MPAKSINEMSKEEKLEFGAKAVERKNNIVEYIEYLNDIENHDLYDNNIYTAEICAQPTWINVTIGSALCLADADGYTNEMKLAALDRRKRTLYFLRALLNEELSEIDKAIFEI